MPKYKVLCNVTYQRELTVYASDDGEAEEKATDIVKDWDNVHDVDVESVEED